MQKFRQEFDYVEIKVASPHRIYNWSTRVLPTGEAVGEVLSSETINYKTFKPEINGLFCEKIFGPTNSWECHCGKYKQIRASGFICEKCNVEIGDTKVRRANMGIIKLNYPVTHIWYLRGLPNYLTLLLDIPAKKLLEIAYFEKDIETVLREIRIKIPRVEEPRAVKFLNKLIEEQNKIIENDMYSLYLSQRPLLVGSGVIRELLDRMDLEEEFNECRKDLFDSLEGNRDKNLFRKIRLFESLLATNMRPEWLILTLLPVIPAGLRPIIRLEGGRFATSDLNELYKTIIMRNNRLSRLLVIYAPDVVIYTEKRLLQDAVDELIDSSKMRKKAIVLNKRKLKCLSDIIAGKQGRFRQNLLGKRVDYSGRSVIVVGPTLKINECGLPYDIIVELFHPFIIHELIIAQSAATIRMAKILIQKKRPIVWKIIEKVLKNHPVLLNRAPTLHRLGVQAFEPVLTEGKTIKLHPLVCPAFNADFDGDQMAVHLPLSIEAQVEARMLMLSSLNILSPATGKPSLFPSQDMVLGCYYMTLATKEKDSFHYFANFEDSIRAYNHDQIKLQTLIWVRVSKYLDIKNKNSSLFISKKIFKDGTIKKIFNDKQVYYNKYGEIQVIFLRTTVGRILFNQSIYRVLENPEII
uniref:DNA-directed RNA polymerase subunit n=1 Tax=Olisthodiscus luteus TaxID=83000 RepID=A0A7U0KSW9_OLILU|nr:RNA polymerase b' subunit [Olisthodiscus luteus]QQW50523.1 RNA polymerase b' subunit [Olisthodiscus luteus]